MGVVLVHLSSLVHRASLELGVNFGEAEIV
jgi:hypothetical protein